MPASPQAAPYPFLDDSNYGFGVSGFFPVYAGSHLYGAQAFFFSSPYDSEPYGSFVYTGGFALYYYFPGGPSLLAGQGAQLYSGTTSNPTFLTGTFQLNDPRFGPSTLTITPESSATPEPSTFILFGTGLFGIISAARRRTS